MIAKVKKRLDEFYNGLKVKFFEMINNDASDHSIAMGFSIGTFIAIIPSPGINILLGALVAFLYKSVNKISLFAGILFWNPLTSIPIFFLSYKIGVIVYGTAPAVIYNVTILDQLYNYSTRFLFGIVICAFLFSILSYPLIRLALVLYRKYRKNKPSSIEVTYADNLDSDVEDKGGLLEVDLDALKKNHHKSLSKVNNAILKKNEDYIPIEEISDIDRKNDSQNIFLPLENLFNQKKIKEQKNNLSKEQKISKK